MNEHEEAIINKLHRCLIYNNDAVNIENNVWCSNEYKYYIL